MAELTTIYACIGSFVLGVFCGFFIFPFCWAASKKSEDKGGKDDETK